MEQMAWNLVDAEDGFLLGKRHLRIDRDLQYTEAFRRMMNGAGVNVVRLPALSPNLNVYAETSILSIKSERFETRAALRDLDSSPGYRAG
jgi:putative transposase